MPIPLVLAGAVAGASALGGAAAGAVTSTAGRVFLKRQLSRHSEEIEKWALSAVMEQLGLPDLVDGPINRETFTKAINQNFLSGYGFELSNVFDPVAVRQDALKFGLVKVADQAGFQLEDVSVKGLSDAIREWVISIIEDEIAMDEAGELLQDARDILEIVQLYRRYKKAQKDGEAAEADGKKPLINTPEAKSNRERQARYRANHKKVWVSKGA